MAMKPTDCGLGPSDYYRADGQRIEKVANASLTWFQASRTSGQYDLNFATSGASTRYFYDGQMGMEDDYNPSGSVTKVNRYGLGARGIDRIERTENSTTTYGYPLYDGHGNMRTTLGRNGTGYTTGTFKTYDVWGSVRSGGDSGDPTQKYCASLGHVSDSDSGLIYMRARYHEPSTGRFISEDSARDGWNWFVYCGSDPVSYGDRSGCQKDLYPTINKWGSPLADLAGMILAALLDPAARVKCGADLAFLAVWFSALENRVSGTGDNRVIAFILMNAMIDIIAVCATWEGYARAIASSSSPAIKVIALTFEHVSFLFLFMDLEEIAEGKS